MTRHYSSRDTERQMTRLYSSRDTERQMTRHYSSREKGTLAERRRKAGNVTGEGQE